DRRRCERTAPAGDPVARAPGARARIHARRARIPLALRPALALARLRGQAVRARHRRTALRGRLRAWRLDDVAVRRQLELARTGLVPGQLPDPGGARALPPLLRRRA